MANCSPLFCSRENITISIPLFFPYVNNSCLNIFKLTSNYLSYVLFGVWADLYKFLYGACLWRPYTFLFTLILLVLYFFSIWTLLRLLRNVFILPILRLDRLLLNALIIVRNVFFLILDKKLMVIPYAFVWFYSVTFAWFIQLRDYLEDYEREKRLYYYTSPIYKIRKRRRVPIKKCHCESYYAEDERVLEPRQQLHYAKKCNVPPSFADQQEKTTTQEEYYSTGEPRDDDRYSFQQEQPHSPRLPVQEQRAMNQEDNIHLQTMSKLFTKSSKIPSQYQLSDTNKALLDKIHAQCSENQKNSPSNTMPPELPITLPCIELPTVESQQRANAKGTKNNH